MKKLLISFLWITTCAVQAQVVTLDECRQLALENNNKTKIDQEALLAAQAHKNAAIANFFPKFGANGGYSYNSLDVHLVGTQHEFDFGSTDINGNFVWKENWADKAESVLPFVGPEAKSGLNYLQGEVGNVINEQYANLYKELTLDFRHTLVGQVGVTQPIFLGGKIVQTYKIAKAGEAIAEQKQKYDRNELLYSVDEAYWRVVSVEQKKLLAQQYNDLLKKLSHDVDILTEEGLATRSDQLKIKTKALEAEEKLGQATDGLILSKMALCQIIGKQLDFDIHVDSTGLYQLTLVQANEQDNDVDKREEIQMLEQAKQVAKATKGLAASTLMPNIVATANYVMMNKNVEDGFQANKFQGWVNAGVVVNIPIAHANDIYKVKAAKHEERMAELAVEEMREKLILQVTQSRQKISAAQRKLIRTQATAENAEEVLRMASESFQEGVLSSTDLMAAQTQWMSAKSEWIDAAIELRLAELTYKKQTGKEL